MDFQKMTLTSRIGKDRGMTLIEMAIVLAIVGLVVGGIWATAASVSHDLKVEQTKKDIILIANNIRSLYPGTRLFQTGDQGSETPIDFQKWLRAGAIPRSFANTSGTDGLNLWGGALRVFASAPDTFFILLRDVPVTTTCIKMLNHMIMRRGYISAGIDRIWTPEAHISIIPDPINHPETLNAAFNTPIAIVNYCTGKTGFGFRFMLHSS